MTQPRFFKLFVLVNGVVPAALLAWDAVFGRLGANPVNFAIRTTGLLALIFLVLSLVVTPAARLTGLNWITAGRRMLGLYAFFYTVGHFAIFFFKDRAASVSSTVTEITARVYLQIGMAALLLMVPLAVTSVDGMVRWMGPKRWKWLHRLAYMAALGGVIHYYLQVKSDTTQPLVFAAVLAALLLYRWVYTLVRAGAVKPVPAAAPMAREPAAVPVRTKPKYWTGRLKVTRTFDETPDVRTFRLGPLEGDKIPFDYMPGQYLNLALTIDAKPVKRSYTIASSPTRAGYCELTVKRDGVASMFLHDHVHEGDVLNVSAPAGKFTFDVADAPSLVMIAGGVGITPLMTKIRYLTDLSWPGQLHLIFVAKTDADLIYRDELDMLQKRHPNLHVTVTLTRGTGPGRRGRLSADLVREVIPDFTTHVYHLCGPGEMLESTRTLLTEIGVPAARVKFESFATPRRADAPNEADEGDSAPVEPETADPAPAQAEAAAVVTFARSGRTAPAPAGKVILEIAEDLGLDLPYDCRTGTCGTCKVRMTQGRVSMETQDALSKAERAGGMILCCQAIPLEPVTIDA